MRVKIGLFCLLVFSLASTAGGEVVSLTLIHINDLHAHMLPDRRSGAGGMAILSTFLKQERARDPDLLFLDAGDLLSGSAADTFTEGRLTYRRYALLKPDVQVLGNHDFDYGVVRLWENLTQVRFPVLCANYRFPTRMRKRIRSYRILTRKGIRIGVLGLTIPRYVKGLKGVRNPVETAKRIYPVLRSRCDLVVALTHLGLDRDRDLAGAVPGLDLIVGGHSHTALEKPERVGRTFILQAGCYGRYAGRARIRFDTVRKRLLSVESSLLPLRGIPPDPRIVAAVEACYRSHGQWTLTQPIARLHRTLERDVLARLAVREARRRFSADAAFALAPSFREGMGPGLVYGDDLFRIYPFQDDLWMCTVSSSWLRRLRRSRKARDAFRSSVLVADPPLHRIRIDPPGRARRVVMGRYLLNIVEREGGIRIDKRCLGVLWREVLRDALVRRFPLPVKRDVADAFPLWVIWRGIPWRGSAVPCVEGFSGGTSPSAWIQ